MGPSPKQAFFMGELTTVSEYSEPGYYAIIPADVRYKKGLPANAKLLYGEITALANKEGYCWASNGYFADLYGVAEVTVSRWVSKLQKYGFVSVSVERNYKRRIFLRPPHKKIKEAQQKDQRGITKRSKGVQQKDQENNTVSTTGSNTNNIYPQPSVAGKDPNPSNTNLKAETTHWYCERCGEPRTGSKHRCGRAEVGYPPDFEELWSEYPRRKDKKAGYLKYVATLRKGKGADPGELLIAAKNYAAEMAREKRAPEYIKKLQTFFGHTEPWREYVAGVPAQDNVKSEDNDPWRYGRNAAPNPDWIDRPEDEIVDAVLAHIDEYGYHDGCWSGWMGWWRYGPVTMRNEPYKKICDELERRAVIDASAR